MVVNHHMYIIMYMLVDFVRMSETLHDETALYMESTQMVRAAEDIDYPVEECADTLMGVTPDEGGHSRAIIRRQTLFAGLINVEYHKELFCRSIMFFSYVKTFGSGSAMLHR